MTENGYQLPSFKPFRPGAKSISISGRHFVDKHGRVLHLRGANVGSASKVPIRPCPPFHLHTQSSYVGRPFPLEEAPENWRRLRSWGLTFLRINVTWEALEHAGPGLYDLEYLDYLRKLLISMQEHGLVAYVSIHQDVFSRYCGGSGAPGWVVEAAGFDLSDDGEKMALSGSAFLDGIRGGRLQGERGLWPTGYQKLACATMNTLFWGGETFAPSFKVAATDGKQVNIQTYLQNAFLAAVNKLVETVGDMDGVMGFEMVNEPHPGFIGLTSIHEWNYNTDLHLGQFPSPLQSFSMGAGHPTPGVPIYVRTFPWPTRKSHTVTANPTSANVWCPDGPTRGQCPWEREGVWRWSEQKGMAMAMQEDYFAKNRSGKPVDFYRDFYFPFVKKWEEIVDRRAKGKAKLVEPVPNEYCPEWPQESRPRGFVFSPHWYDLNAMFKKHFGFMTVNVQGLSRGMFILNALYWGKEGAKKNYVHQIRTLVTEARKRLGEVPIVFGECGIPMDLNNEEAFRTGDFKWQERMISSLISAMESSLVGFNLWAYNPHNRDDIGDDWNAENFSWYSDNLRDKVVRIQDSRKLGAGDNLDVGGRLLDVIVRPYAIATAGTPLSLSYDAETAAFSYRFRNPLGIVKEEAANQKLSEVTEIFLPKRVYTENNTQWTVSSGGQVIFDWDNHRVWMWFVDSPAERREAEKVRRFDIWVPEKARKQGISTMQGTLLILALAVGALAAYYVQMMEWENERRMGLRK